MGASQNPMGGMQPGASARPAWAPQGPSPSFGAANSFSPTSMGLAANMGPGSMGMPNSMMGINPMQSMGMGMGMPMNMMGGGSMGFNPMMSLFGGGMGNMGMGNYGMPMQQGGPQSFNRISPSDVIGQSPISRSPGPNNAPMTRPAVMPAPDQSGQFGLAQGNRIQERMANPNFRPGQWTGDTFGQRQGNQVQSVNAPSVEIARADEPQANRQLTEEEQIRRQDRQYRQSQRQNRG